MSFVRYLVRLTFLAVLIWSCSCERFQSPTVVGRWISLHRSLVLNEDGVAYSRDPNSRLKGTWTLDKATNPPVLSLSFPRNGANLVRQYEVEFLGRDRLQLTLIDPDKPNPGPGEMPATSFLLKRHKKSKPDQETQATSS